MSKISKENIKRLLNKTTTAPDEDNDLLTKGYGVASISGDISGAQGVTVVNAGGGAIEIGLGAITPAYLGTPTAVIANLATASGLSVTGGASLVTLAVTNQATMSGVDVTGSVDAVTADISNIAQMSGLVVTQSATYNRITESGAGPVAPIPNGPSGVGSVDCGDWLEVTVNGGVYHIPLYS